jgi:hypothetical protein
VVNLFCPRVFLSPNLRVLFDFLNVLLLSNGDQDIAILYDKIGSRHHGQSFWQHFPDSNHFNMVSASQVKLPNGLTKKTGRRRPS